MKFSIGASVEVLSATPGTLRSLLGGVSDEWTSSFGDRENWQPYDVLGHLIHGEKTDWIPRARIILQQGEDREFETFDRLAQFESSEGSTVNDLLDEFERLRAANLEVLKEWHLTEEQLDLTGIHPQLGTASLRQLIATWAVHDLNHVRQIITAMAKRYDEAVGPWKPYLGVLNTK
ncbi:MAG: DinB family protein [Chloracidobacterium sp.]|nr:DinB family protein [Chloracidobacterium sp.]